MGIIDNAKEIVKIIQQIDNIELYRKILDLQSEINNLDSENANLKNQLSELEQKFCIQQSLRFDDNTYMRILPNGKEEGPFCTACWDNNKKSIRLRSYGHSEYLECPVCRSEDFEFEESEIFPEDSGKLTCKKCSSLIYIEFYSDGELISASYREDLEYINQLKVLITTLF